MGCDRKPCSNQQGDNKIHAHWASPLVWYHWVRYRWAPSAHMVPWGTNVKGEKGENGFEPIGTDDRDLVTHRSPCDGRLLGRTWRASREPPARGSTNSFIREVPGSFEVATLAEIADQAPRRVPRIFPLVRYRHDIAVIDMRPFVIAPPLASLRRRLPTAPS